MKPLMRYGWWFALFYALLVLPTVIVASREAIRSAGLDLENLLAADPHRRLAPSRAHRPDRHPHRMGRPPTGPRTPVAG